MMQKSHVFGPVGERTVFSQEESSIRLSRLCGITCADDVSEFVPVFPAPAEISTSRGQCQGESFCVVESSFANNSARVVWSIAGIDLQLESVWSFCPETGIASRKDKLTNVGNQEVCITRCHQLFTFPPGEWEVYAQRSRWSNENQGRWLPLHAGSLRFGCLPGRTTEGGTPYCCLRRYGTSEALAFHVLPQGNWTIDVRARAVQNESPYALLSLGMADDDLRLALSPGKSWELPEILVQPLPAGEPHLAAPALHGYVNKRFFSSTRLEMPVVYNTWFDQFEVLELPRLRGQLQAAKEVGCEVFVVDAGWYGPAADDWWSQAGDWRERTTTAFQGNMKQFADEVRAAGLGFGLWMEPERFGRDVPIVKKNPKWFLPGDGGFFRIDLQNPDAYAYLRGEISRLVETYELAWMKVDFNFRLGPDPSGAELSGYYEAWYRLLDEIRQKYPQTVFEECSSGGMRLDLKVIQHSDGHFFSDTVNPLDVIRIWQGALLRLPPGRLIKWNVLRPIGKTIPTYTKSLADSPPAIVAPYAAIWEPSQTVDVDFAAAVTLAGTFALGGDLAGLPPQARGRLAEHVEFFKQRRVFIRGSEAHLLTPPQAKENRQGWAAVQLTNRASDDSLLFVYRLDDGAASSLFTLRGLDEKKEYLVRPHIPAGIEPHTCPGGDLLHEGIQVELPARYRAALYVLTPK